MARVSLRDLQIAELNAVSNDRPQYYPQVGGAHFETPTEFGISDQYITLDSYERDMAGSAPERGQLQYNISARDFTNAQSIGTRYDVNNITEAQVSAFVFPTLAPVPYVLNSGAHGNAGLPVLAANPAPTAGQLFDPLHTAYTQLPYGDRVTLEVKEFGTQSVSDRKGMQHTFEFEVQYFPYGANFGTALEPDRLVLQPILGSELYIFTDPLSVVNSRLTLEFRGLDAPLNLPRDIIDNATAAVDATGHLRFTVPDGHGLQTGDRVIITGFSSGNPVIDRWVNVRVGRAVGELDGAALEPTVTGATDGTPYVTHPTEFTLNPNVGVAVLGGAGTPVASNFRIYVPKNRIRVPLRLRRLVNRRTQLIVP